LKTKQKILKLPFYTLLATILFFFLSVTVTVASATITVSPNVHFGFCNNNYICFSTQQTFSAIYRTNNFWYFGSYGFNIENGNLTVTKIEESELILNLSAPTGFTSTTKLVLPSKPSTVIINGYEKAEGQNWTWNSNNNTLTLTYTHQSSAIIRILWKTGSFTSIPSHIKAVLHTAIILIGLMCIIFAASALVNPNPKLILEIIMAIIICSIGAVIAMTILGQM